MGAPRVLGRLLLAAASAVAALLLLEGALSLAGARTLRERLTPVAPILETARRARAAPDPALLARDFDIHADPRVGRVFRPDSTLTLREVTVTTDELGMRRRPGPSRGADPLRVVILGDSVAFGWGLRDEETLAAQLEELLAAHRAPDARPVECRTVAVPGWNARNAFAFLFDHLDALAPDVVVFQPVGNDVCDAITTYDTASGPVEVPDLASEDPWFHVGYDADFLGELMERRQRGELRLALDQTGPAAVDTGLGRLSRLRFAEMAGLIRDADARLARRGARFYMAPHVGGEFIHLLLDALLDAGGRTREIALFERLEPEDMLGGDPHPSTAAAGHQAAWLADALATDGALPGGLARAVAAPPADVVARRRAQPADAQVREAARQAREAAHALLLPELSAETGRGCLQVYGGMGAGGVVEARVQFMLRRDGDVLRLRLAALEGHDELLPLAIRVELDGEVKEVLTLTRAEVTTFSLGVGARAGGDVLDVKLVPERWITVPNERGGWRLASFRFVDAVSSGP